jgi:putative ABC transport system permease protein
MRFLLLILKNLRRNKLRSALTAAAVLALVFIFSMIATVVMLFDQFTAEKSSNVQVMISDRHNMMMPFQRSHLETIVNPNSELCQQLQKQCNFNPEKHSVWHFVILALDPELKEKEKQFFLLGTLPDKIATMTDGISPKEVPPEAVQLMKKPPRSKIDGAGVVMGERVLKRINKNVGDVFKAYAILHRDGSALRRPIEFELEVVGAIPDSNRWNDAGFVDYAYVDKTLNANKNEFDGRLHYIFLEFPDKPKAEQGSIIIEKYIPQLKSEIASTAWARMIEPLNPMLWGVKYLLVPAIFAVMTVILANAFSITVRERQTEMAVLKVLGFTSTRVLLLVMGEALMVGALAGLLSATITYCAMNYGAGGLRMTGFPTMPIPAAVFWWGPAMGIVTSFLGGIIPALHARSVKVSNVFASVA